MQLVKETLDRERKREEGREMDMRQDWMEERKLISRLDAEMEP